MTTLRFVTLNALLLAATSAHADDAPPAQPIQVIILGTYHFGNPGHDLHNVDADDVTTPRRQAELADVAKRLEQFKPTRVAIEAVVDAPDLKVAAYRKFTPADLGKTRNESVQIGYRIAHDARLADVYGIDELSDTIDYFPYDKVQSYAKQHGTEARLTAMQAKVGALISDFTASQKSSTVAALLAQMNEPPRIRSMHADFYYGLLPFGDAKTQAGAELNAYWYMRNAKIFGKLMQVARPGDRILVVYGAGHAYWLRHFVENTPGFQLVEPNRYLTGKQP